MIAEVSRTIRAARQPHRSRRFRHEDELEDGSGSCDLLNAV